MSSGILIRKTKQAAHAAPVTTTVVRAPRRVRPSGYFAWKGVVDRVVASLLLAPALPLIGLLALGVRLTSPGPVVYRQRRMGKDGRMFTLYKLRSMRIDAETRTGAIWSSEHDPRVTRFGRFLRACHLDELPQLFNVLRGDMSLVGPRPERPEIVCVLQESIADYGDRLSVRPGVTGLAQLNLPPDSVLDDVRRKLVLDAEYIRRASLWLDLRILLCTFARIFKAPACLALRPLALQRIVDLPAPAAGGNGDGDGPTTPGGVAEQPNVVPTAVAKKLPWGAHRNPPRPR